MIRNTNAIRKLAGPLFATLALAVAAPAGAQENMFDGNWHFSITPYLWLPNVSGSTAVNKPVGTVQRLSTNVSPSSWLADLEGAALISAEARKGEWSIFTDYIYLNFNRVNARGVTVTGPAGNPVVGVNLGTDVTLKGDVWTLAGGYAVIREKNTHMDVFGGFRSLGLETSINWNLAGTLGLLPALTGTATQKIDKWDAIIGAKGQLGFGESGKWYAPYYVDAGSGSGNTTWQAMAGVGYRYGWGDVTLSVRSLSYKFTDSNADIRFTGPELAAVFRF